MKKTQYFFASALLIHELRLSEAQLMEVREQWTGGLRYVLELLLPLMTLLYPGKNTNVLLEVQSEDQLLEFLASCRNPSLDGKELINLAREYPDPYNFGLQCSRRFHYEVDLRRWNDAVVKYGGHVLQNRQASNEFDAQILQAKQFLRSMLAFTVRTGRHDKSFRDRLAELEGVNCPATFADTLWEVRVSDALTAYIPFFRTI